MKLLLAALITIAVLAPGVVAAGTLTASRASLAA